MDLKSFRKLLESLSAEEIRKLFYSLGNGAYKNRSASSNWILKHYERAEENEKRFVIELIHKISINGEFVEIRNVSGYSKTTSFNGFLKDKQHLATWLAAIIPLLWGLWGLAEGLVKYTQKGAVSTSVKITTDCTNYFKDRNATSFKILLVDFEFDEKKAVAELIAERFYEKILKEDLGINILHCKNVEYPKNLTQAQLLLDRYGADVILYGKFLNGGLSCNKGEICYNYVVNSEVEYTLPFPEYSLGGLQKIETFSEVQSGYKQEKYDNLIYWLSALHLSKNERYSRALYYLNKIPINPLDPISIDYWYLKGICYVEQGEMGAAVTAANHIHNNFPGNERAIESAQKLLTNIYSKNGDVDKSLQQYKNLFKTNRLYLLTIFEDLYIATLNGRFDYVEDRLDAVYGKLNVFGLSKDSITLDKTEYKYYSVSFDTNMNSSNSLVFKKDDLVNCLNLYGMYYKIINKFDRALIFLSSAYTLDPTNSETCLWIGDTYYFKKDFGSAYFFYDRAIQNDSTNILALHFKSELLTRQGDYVNAKTCALKAYQLLGSIVKDVNQYQHACSLYKILAESSERTQDKNNADYFAKKYKEVQIVGRCKSSIMPVSD